MSRAEGIGTSLRERRISARAMRSRRVAIPAAAMLAPNDLSASKSQPDAAERIIRRAWKGGIIAVM